MQITRCGAFASIGGIQLFRWICMTLWRDSQQALRFSQLHWWQSRRPDSTGTSTSDTAQQQMVISAIANDRKKWQVPPPLNGQMLAGCVLASLTRNTRLKTTWSSGVTCVTHFLSEHSGLKLNQRDKYWQKQPYTVYISHVITCVKYIQWPKWSEADANAFSLVLQVFGQSAKHYTY